MRRDLLSIVAVLAFIALAAGSTDTNQTSSGSGVSSYTPTPPSREEIARQNVELVSFEWQKGGFGSVMLADFTVRNKNDFPVKDITITCIHSGNSGTEIDRNTKTIYEIIKPQKKRTFREVSMGFIHSEATRSRCEVSGVVPAG